MSIVSKQTVMEKLDLLAHNFSKTLYEEDTAFMKNFKKIDSREAELKKYQHWEWPQGICLYGIWRYFEFTHDTQYLNILTDYYDRQLETGFPGRNVNTTAPFLALSFLAEFTGNSKYMEACNRWAEWIINSFPRTKEDGFQHITSDSVNEQELWDDTLFMTVLFLARMGSLQNNTAYTEEAIYQFLIHAKYLTDKKTGLWYHGWTFNGADNFAGAFWGRGNSWITAGIPELLSITECTPAVKKYLTGLLRNQVTTLMKCQDSNGAWHTILDDPASYIELSATCGIAYGMLKAVHMGLLESSCNPCVDKALQVILNNISDDGTVQQVSYGTPMGRDSKDFYKKIPLRSMPYGPALAVLFLEEVIRTKEALI